MVLYRSQLAVLGLALALSGSAACGDDKDTGGEGDGSGGGDGSGSCDKELPEIPDPFVAKVTDSTNITMAIPGAKAYLYDLATGDIDMSTEQVAGGDGMVTFSGRRENTGVFVEGDGTNTQNTYNVPPSRTGEEMIVRVGSTGAATLVPGLAQYTSDQEAAPLAGSVLWFNKCTGEHEYVGCAQIEMSDSVADVRYFMGSLPTNLSNRTLEQGTVPSDGGSNDGEAGKYFIANVKGGQQTVTAKIGDKVIGSVDLYVVPRKDGGTIQSSGEKSSLMLANIVVSDEFTENPTPADCE
jgi:hypothetical protein